MTKFQKVLIAISSVVNYLGLTKLSFVRRSFWRTYLVYKKYYEGKEFIEILNMLSRFDDTKKDSCVLDIGAHIGSSAHFIFNALAPSKIFSFEPDKRNIEYFNEFIQGRIKNNLITLVPLAVWKVTGTIPFYFNEKNTADNKFEASESSLVECVAVDDFVTQFSLKVSLIKIDVQGYEIEVLQGSLITLSTQQPLVIIEIDKNSLDARGLTISDILDFIDSIKYRPLNSRSGATLDLAQLHDDFLNRSCLDILLAPFPKN